MASSPSIWELPVAVAADGIAVPVLHPPPCSVCQFTDFNHLILKGVYNSLCEVNSNLEVLARDSIIRGRGFYFKMGLRKAGFQTGKSVPRVMACEISPQMSDYRVKRIRKILLEMKVAAMISMKFDSKEIPPDWFSRDQWWFGWINSSEDFSFEHEGVSSTEVKKIDTPWYLFDYDHNDPKFYFRVLVQMPDDPEQYESVVLDIPASTLRRKVISSFQSVAAEEHIIDFYEPMPETKKIIPVRRFSNEATDPAAKLNEIVIGITGQAAFSIMGYALTGSSSSPASYFVVGATAIGFICTFIALTLKGTKKPAARILGKVGAMAAACAVIVAMGMFLPANTIWITGIACLIGVVAVALA